MNVKQSQSDPDAAVTWQRTAKALVFLTLVAIILVSAGRRFMTFPDVICYWSAGKILASGHSPYDAALQTLTQHEFGWDKKRDGFGIYDFLPFYYPPWFGFLWVIVLPLGFEGAKTAWFFVNVELTLVTGYLLRRTVPQVAAWLPFVLVSCFLFTVTAIVLGQTTILVFFLMALTWRLLDLRWDRSAGVVMAWLTIKPQLTAVLLVALVIWLIRQRRWDVLGAFFVTGAVLGSVSTLVLPGWLPDMLNAPRLPPSPPTEYYPWIGNAWFLLLRTWGLEGPVLWLLYLAIALPFLGYVLWRAFLRSTDLADVMAISVLAAFFVAPYARHYDFPALLIPVLALLAKRPASVAFGLLVLVLAFIPFLQWYFLEEYKASHDPSGYFRIECTYFWVPVLCAVAWFVAIRWSRQVPAALAIQAAASSSGIQKKENSP